jgi:hypothetical protein
MFRNYLQRNKKAPTETISTHCAGANFQYSAPAAQLFRVISLHNDLARENIVCSSM